MIKHKKYQISIDATIEIPNNYKITMDSWAKNKDQLLKITGKDYDFKPFLSLMSNLDEHNLFMPNKLCDSQFGCWDNENENEIKLIKKSFRKRLYKLDFSSCLVFPENFEFTIDKFGVPGSLDTQESQFNLFFTLINGPQGKEHILTKKDLSDFKIKIEIEEIKAKEVPLFVFKDVERHPGRNFSWNTIEECILNPKKYWQNEEEQKEYLPESKPGFKWIIYHDITFLAGCRGWLEVNEHEKDYNRFYLLAIS